MLRVSCALTGALSVFLLVMGVALAYFEVLRPTAGLALFVLGGVVGFAGVALAAVVLLKHGFVTESVVGFWGAGPLVLLLVSSINLFIYPSINDISTDVEDPPKFVHVAGLPENAGRDMSFPAANAAIVRASYPMVASMDISIKPEEAFRRVESCARSMPGWEVIHADPKTRTIEGFALTTFFRCRNDFVLRIRETKSGATRLDMRSRSREGICDLGANARRIRAFYTALMNSFEATAQAPGTN